ncbi:hypothetical protein AX15_006594 [Amanita polypyramis BW_CC]|nr:hypothetical protein AX15_006594 [Amanita polypyramis BW_CC]
MAALTPSELATTVHHLMAAKMFSLAACVMCFYDIMLTFADEVELIWSRRFTFVSLLWYINRYVSPLAFIIVTVSFHSNWSKEVCGRYVVFPEAVKAVTSFAIGATFVLRLYAIYQRSITVATIFSALLAAELAIKIWAFTDGTYLNLPPGVIGCILVGKHDLRFASTWISELAFDSLVFFATLYRAVSSHRQARRNGGITLLDLIVRDGIMYFACIFAVNLITVLMFVFAPADIKAINASLSTLLTSVMVSRLILNLRGIADRTTEQDSYELRARAPQAYRPKHIRNESSVDARNMYRQDLALLGSRQHHLPGSQL